MHESVKEGPVFPLPAAETAALQERFRLEFAAIQGELVEAESMAEARGILDEWLTKEGLQSLMVVDTPFLRELVGERSSVKWLAPDQTDHTGWDTFDVGITPCESLVAESGTIVVSAGLSGRAPSVLPPIHLVVATKDQFIADLETAIARLRSRYTVQLPSTISFISGPSRTADIEKILVLGAHGPRRLRLLLLPQVGS